MREAADRRVVPDGVAAQLSYFCCLCPQLLQWPICFRIPRRFFSEDADFVSFVPHFGHLSISTPLNGETRNRLK